MATPMQDPSQGPSWLRNDDPLGIGLRQRARDYQSSVNPTGLGMQGPLQDPAWEGLKQALFENADHVGGMGGMQPSYGPRSSTAIQQGRMQPPAGRPMPPSNGNPLLAHPAIKALQRTR